MNGTDDLLLTSQMAEFIRTRHFGKYRGIVSNITDPQNVGRIRAKVPAIFGEEESPWAMPALPFAGPKHGLVLLPEVNDGVWIEFEAGDPASPIWSGCWWARDQMPEPKGETIRLLATSKDHKILINDQEDKIILEHSSKATITLSNGEISLKVDACEIKITASEVNINNGMVKVTSAGASLVNDAFKVGG